MEISEEMRNELLQGMNRDNARLNEKLQELCNPIHKTEHRTLEEMVYITEEMRLKLKVLGAPRLYN